MNRKRTGIARCALALTAAVWASDCVTSPPIRPATQPRAEPAPHVGPHVELDVQGVTHVVKPGETLWRIARAYRVAPEEIAVANRLADGTKVAAGQELLIPGARALVEVPPADLPPAGFRPAKAGNAPLAWPLIGVLYARFGLRGGEQHDGIDIAAPAGTLIAAAGDGEVVYSGIQKGYGQVVVLQHAGTLITLYAHDQEVLVKEGAWVKVGDPIARIGEASGTSGPHLHFEVREDGVAKDPLKYLPPPR